MQTDNDTLEFFLIDFFIVDYAPDVNEDTLTANGWWPFRVHPSFTRDPKFLSQKTGMRRMVAHFFQIPPGYHLSYLMKMMDDRMFDEPDDIREVLCFGQIFPDMMERVREFFREKVYQVSIYCPTLLGRDDLVIKLQQYPEWRGPGAVISTIDLEDETIEGRIFVAFSSDE